MNYRAWRTKTLQKDEVLRLSKELATQEVERQIEQLLENMPDAEISETEKQRSFMEQSKKYSLVAGILSARNMANAETIEDFLGEGTQLSDPYLLKDMDKAVERILTAIDNYETIVIFGDYDVDGITATALLYEHLKNIGANVKCMLPSREGDGYGLSRGVIQSIYDKGYRLIVTVDNGISAVEEAEFAASLGMELIITDHHIQSGELPKAVAVVNPRRLDDESPFKGLCGAGVAFKLCAALDGCTPEEMLENCGDLAAIGTVADVMPLTGENRTIVKKGLNYLQNSERTGLKVLLEQAGAAEKAVTAETISFAIAPRINAAGRMGSATTALQLVLCEEEERAYEIMENLAALNAQRQKSEQDIFLEAEKAIAEHPEWQEQRVLVVAGHGWHVGVIGIVASRLMEKTGLPSIIVSIDENGEGKGSGRSADGFNLHEGINFSSDLLIRYGGHSMAAGLSIEEKNINTFREKINEWAVEKYPVPQSSPIEVDLKVQLDKLSVQAVQGLDLLAPYGTQNPTPQFLIQDIVVEGVYAMADERHCRLRLRQGKTVMYAAYFGVSVASFPYSVGEHVEAIMQLNVYEGKNGPQISGRVQEMRPLGLSREVPQQAALAQAAINGAKLSLKEIDIITPSREDVAQVYRAVQSEKWRTEDLQPLFAKIGGDKTGKILIALRALRELQLVAKIKDNGVEWFSAVQGAQKRELADATILKRMEELRNG